MARTEAFRALGGFEADFVGAPNETLPSELRLRVRTSSASTRHSLRNISRPVPIRPAMPILRYRLLLVKKYQGISQREKISISVHGAICMPTSIAGDIGVGGFGMSPRSCVFRGRIVGAAQAFHAARPLSTVAEPGRHPLDQLLKVSVHDCSTDAKKIESRR